MSTGRDLKSTFYMPIVKNDKPLNGNKVLSEREVEVFQLAANGLSNKEIADRLHVCEDTIESHNRNLVAKLEASNMKHAVAIGIRKKIIK